MNKKSLEILTDKERCELIRAYSVIMIMSAKAGNEKERAAANKQLLRLISYLPTTIEYENEYTRWHYHGLTQMLVPNVHAAKVLSEHNFKYYSDGLIYLGAFSPSWEDHVFVADPWSLTQEDEIQIKEMTTKCEQDYENVRTGKIIDIHMQEEQKEQEEIKAKYLKRHSNLFVKFQLCKYYDRPFKVPPRFKIKFKSSPFQKEKSQSLTIHEVVTLIRNYIQRLQEQGMDNKTVLTQVCNLCDSQLKHIISTIKTLSNQSAMIMVDGLYYNEESRRQIMSHFSCRHCPDVVNLPKLDKSIGDGLTYHYVTTYFKSIDRSLFKVLEDFKDTIIDMKLHERYKLPDTIEFLGMVEMFENLHQHNVDIYGFPEFLEELGIVEKKEDTTDGNTETIDL